MERNYDLLYLLMVGVFLLASVLLLFWNRAREKMETGKMPAAGAVTADKSHLPPEPPALPGKSGRAASGEDKREIEMWYYSIDGNCKRGPVTEEELRRLLGARRLLPDTLVWTRALPYWREASAIDDFDELTGVNSAKEASS